ncbi:MAG TPA: pentapeptide repeat-containing protein [Candidatus Caenarcaniphilales bacterium]
MTLDPDSAQAPPHRPSANSDSTRPYANPPAGELDSTSHPASLPTASSPAELPEVNQAGLLSGWRGNRFLVNPRLREVIAITAVSLLLIGLLTNTRWLGIPAALVTLVLSLRILWPPLLQPLVQWLVSQRQSVVVAGLTALGAIAAVIQLSGFNQLLNHRVGQINWEAFGALGEVFGALGQILIAVLALYVTWRQYVISKGLTIQQNRITQQQTIDAYFQGIAELVLDDEGLLEDWPQERALAEGRTAAILSSVDAEGKAKVLRFLSGSKLLTPLQRDRRLGRPMFDGNGGYAEDVEQGVRVIDLGVMLAKADLAGNDLRWTDLSEANLVGANLSNCDLTRTNLARTILYDACLVGAELERTRLFYGDAKTATPRSRIHPPDYHTGAQTGAVIENADFKEVRELSAEQRYYCCAWGGARTRATIPGGCDGIPNKLGR